MKKYGLLARQKNYDDKVGKPTKGKGLAVVPGAFHRPGSNKK